MARPKRVLLLCNSELGQANCFLATGYALAVLAPDVEVHFASYPAIKAAVASTSELARQVRAEAKPAIFHSINAMSSLEAWGMNLKPEVERLARSPPRFWNLISTLSTCARLVLPYTGEQMVDNYEQIARIVADVGPDLVAVDNTFSIGMTVLRSLGTKFVILSPNALKDFLTIAQPRQAILWKYPCCATGWPFPLPWYLIPLNAYIILYSYLCLRNESHARKAKKYLKARTGADVYGGMELLRDGCRSFKTLVSCRPELDFPLDFIPPNVVSCGPILRAVEPVEAVDGGLASWLEQGPTILIALGSHAWTEESQAIEMAKVIRALFDAEVDITGRSELQVIWKLKRNRIYDSFGADSTGGSAEDCGGDIEDIIGREMQDGRVRVVPWLAADPYAIQQTGHIVCSVNHGGANSFWEAFVCGVPQVTLPAWLDTYDFAHRSEMLGVGRWGSRKSAPGYSAKELGPVLVDVVLGPQAERMKDRAAEWAKFCEAKGCGRDVAARAILDELESIEVKGAA